jgi:hypothetical protein
MRAPSIAAAAVLAVLIAPQPARAWGFEAHRFIMDRAIAQLPAEIRPFFEKYRTAIVEHVIDPDLWRAAGWDAEPPRHFLDMDAYGPFPFSQLPRDYNDAVARYGEEFVRKNGLLPWRTGEIYVNLVEAFTQKTPYARENIKFFSSVIAHYLSDAHVPLHAVLNYDGQLTGQWGVHSRFESELFERYGRGLAIVTPPRPATKTGLARDFTFEVLLESFPLAQHVLEADKSAAAGRDVYDDEYFTLFFGKVRPILERRLSDSIARVAHIIEAAWIEAGRPVVPLDQPRLPRKVRRS